MRDGTYYLIATVDLPEPAAYEPTDWLGVDLGIVNVATTVVDRTTAAAHRWRHE